MVKSIPNLFFIALFLTLSSISFAKKVKLNEKTNWRSYAKTAGTRKYKTIHSFNFEAREISVSSDGAYYAVGLEDELLYVLKGNNFVKAGLNIKVKKICAAAGGVVYFTRATNVGIYSFNANTKKFGIWRFTIAYDIAINHGKMAIIGPGEAGKNLIVNIKTYRVGASYMAHYGYEGVFNWANPNLQHWAYTIDFKTKTLTSVKGVYGVKVAISGKKGTVCALDNYTQNVMYEPKGWYYKFPTNPMYSIDYNDGDDFIYLNTWGGVVIWDDAQQKYYWTNVWGGEAKLYKKNLYVINQGNKVQILAPQ